MNKYQVASNVFFFFFKNHVTFCATKHSFAVGLLF